MFEPLEPRILLTTDTFNVTITDDLIIGDGETSLREAIIGAHESTADNVRINLAPNELYEITRATNDGPSPFAATEFLEFIDPEFGDFDISRDIVIHGSTITSNRAEAFDGRYGDDPDYEDGDNAFGGAIYIDGGALILDATTVSNNTVAGGAGDGHTDERDIGVGGDGGDAYGGAIAANAADITIRNYSRLEGNRAAAGFGGLGNDNGGGGGNAYGGAIHLDAGVIDIADSTITNNQSVGGQRGKGIDHFGGDGDEANGGAIHANARVDMDQFAPTAVFRSATITIADSDFENNTAQAGSGGDGEDRAPAGGHGGEARGGAVFADHRVETAISRSTFDGNDAHAARSVRTVFPRPARIAEAGSGSIHSCVCSQSPMKPLVFRQDSNFALEIGAELVKLAVWWRTGLLTSHRRSRSCETWHVLSRRWRWSQLFLAA